MIDINKEDERLINDALHRIEQGGYFPSLFEILTKFASDKNKVFEAICQERLDDKIDSIAQEKAKDINGVPVRTMLARDFAVALINKMERFTNEEVTGIAVELADTLLKRLKR